jgi:hypothetical protein
MIGRQDPLSIDGYARTRLALRAHFVHIDKVRQLVGRGRSLRSRSRALNDSLVDRVDVFAICGVSRNAARCES